MGNYQRVYNLYIIVMYPIVQKTIGVWLAHAIPAVYATMVNGIYWFAFKVSILTRLEAVTWPRSRRTSDSTCSSFLIPSDSAHGMWQRLHQVLNLVDTIAQCLFLTLLGVGLGGLEHSEAAVEVLHGFGTMVCISQFVAPRHSAGTKDAAGIKEVGNVWYC